MKMKSALTVLAAAAAALLAQGAFAQASSPTRAEVKAEAAANKTPAGEATGAKPLDTKSTTTRAQRKAATKAARKEGDLTPAGEAEGAKTPDTKSTTTRAQRKAATAEARKDGTLTPAGEGPAAPAK
jgi:hypothetical protein